MSICTTVFFNKTSSVSLESWTASARKAGFDLDLGGLSVLEEHCGGLPVACDGVRGGFEIYLEPIADYLEESADDFSWLEGLRIRRYSHVAEFVTHSRHDDLFVATVAAASLAHSNRGLLLDCSLGKFVRYRNVLQWLKREAKPPSVEDLRHRDASRDVVHSWIGSVLREYGFETLSAAPGAEERQESKWFYRQGTQFTSELIEASVDSDLSQSWLCLTFFGSLLSLSELQEQGLTGNAGGWYLHQYYPDDCYSWPEPPLPQNIEVDEQFPQSREAPRLRKELSEAHQRLFEELYKHSSLVKRDGGVS